MKVTVAEYGVALHREAPPRRPIILTRRRLSPRVRHQPGAGPHQQSEPIGISVPPCIMGCRFVRPNSQVNGFGTA